MSGSVNSISDLFDQVERFFETQIPDNLHELPSRVIDRLQEMTGEFYRTARDFEIDITPLTLSLPPHIQPSPPPPPPPPPRLSPSADLARLISSYPIWSGLGAIGMVWGLGQAGLAAVEKREMKLAKNKKGKTSDGYMVEAVLILCPTSETSLLLPLILSLLTNHYIVLLSLPELDQVEEVEHRVKNLDSRLMDGLWVGVLDVDDSTSVHAFHRSFYASLTTRYACPFPDSSVPHHPGKSKTPRDRYAPMPHHLPKLKSVFNLYGLGSSKQDADKPRIKVPPIPALLRPPISHSSYTPVSRMRDSNDAIESKKPNLESRPSLFTFIAARSTWPVPKEFETQLASLENLVLGQNLAVRESPQQPALIKRHVKFVLSDLTNELGALNLGAWVRGVGSDACRSQKPRRRVEWFDATPLSLFNQKHAATLPLSTKLGAFSRFLYNFVYGSITYPVRSLYSGWTDLLNRQRRAKTRRANWGSVEDTICRGLRGDDEHGMFTWLANVGGLAGVVGIGQGSIWPYMVSSFLPSAWLIKLLNSTSIAHLLPSAPVSDRIFEETSSNTRSSPFDSSSSHETRDDHDSNRSDLGASSGVEDSGSNMDASWVGVEGQGQPGL